MPKSDQLCNLIYVMASLLVVYLFHLVDEEMSLAMRVRMLKGMFIGKVWEGELVLKVWARG